MATRVSTSDLRTLVRDLGEFPSSQISDAMLNRWLNLAIARLYDRLIDQDEARYYKTATVSIVADTQSYDVETDFYRLIGVDVVDSSASSGYVTLQRADFRDRNVYTYEDKKGARYDLRDGKLYIQPTPNWSGTLRIHYIPNVSTYGDETETPFDFVNHMEEYVVIDTAIKCAMRLDEDPTLLINERNRLEGFIRGKTTTLDHSGPKTVRDVYGATLHHRGSDFDDFGGDWR